MKIEERGDVVFLSGDITQESQFRNLRANNGQIRLDLSGIRTVNSVGVRAWVMWLRTTGLKLIYQNCSPAVVEQLNLIPNLLENDAHVESVQVPLYCPNCNARSILLLQNGTDFVAGKMPILTMPTCTHDNTLLTPEVEPGDYFFFLEAEE